MISKFKKIVLVLFAILISICYSFFKFVTKKFTGLCELQRICYATDQGAKRCIEIEKSIENSKSPILIKVNKKLTELSSVEGKFSCKNKHETAQMVEYAVEAICTAKSINVKVHEDFIDAMRMSLLQIYGYKQLCHEVNSLKDTSYDSNNKKHESYLMEIWSSLNPDENLDERISKKWSNIGFQGNDPKTDFRGMGILGLLNLHYFVTKHALTARSMLLHSNHPVTGYPFAITSINLTHMAFVLLNNCKLKSHFFNTINGTMNLNDFHQVFCYLFVHFDRLWLKEKPKNVMEFSHIKEKFLEQLDSRLIDDHCKLIWQASNII